jgi:hypothetical protein
MKPLLSLFIPAFLSSFTSIGQTEGAPIILKGYRCFFYDKGSTNVPAAMYKANDTFIFYLYTRDIWSALDETREKDTPEKELELGLKECFGDVKYIKTKDSLYIATWGEKNVYNYLIYVPEQSISLCVRSNKNDTDFSEKSKWLLSQVRKNRKKRLFFANERHQTCSDPFNPKSAY